MENSKKGGDEISQKSQCLGFRSSTCWLYNGGKWGFKQKIGSDDSIEHYKARLVAIHLIVWN